MIFVTVGTQPQQFKRLFNELERLVEETELQERIIAQIGNNGIHSSKIECFDYIDIAHMQELMREARLIISHGGTGSIITALKMGKTVIGIPRMAKFGEHINDHQKDLIDALSVNNLIIPVYDIHNLKKAIDKSHSFIPTKFVSGTNIILDDIYNYITNCYPN